MIDIFNFTPTKKSKNFIVNIKLNKNFSKSEKEFFELLIFNFDLASPYISLDSKDLIKVLNLDTDSKLQDFLHKITDKKVLYSITEEEAVIYSGAFSPVSSYFQKKEKIYIFTAEELKLFLTEENIFSHFNFKKFIFMEKNLSLILYNHLNNILPANTLSVTVTELKELFGLEDSYNRIYDFEKYILKKIVKNINKYTDLEVKYEKPAHSGSVINFTFKSTYRENIFEKTKEIIDTVKSKIINYENVYNLILNYLEKRGLSYVNNNVSYINSLKNIQNFDAHLRKALLYDLYSSNLKNIKPESKFISFFEKYHVYKNSVTLQNDLYKYINSILYITSSLEELYSFEVINEIKNLEDGSFFTYKNQDFEIFVEFLQNKNSSIQIFIREDLI